MSCVLPSFMSEDWFLKFLKLYNNLIRSKNESDNIELYKHCLKTEQHSEANEILKPYLLRPHLVLDELANATYRADIYEQIVFGLVVHIRNKFGIKNFEMILDSTKATTSQALIVDLQRLETLTKTHKMSDFCTVHDDISISEVVMMDSKEEIGIRMSDLMAGLYSWTFKSAENRQSDVGQALINMLPEDNLIHMIASDQVTPADLGMEGTSNPFL